MAVKEYEVNLWQQTNEYSLADCYITEDYEYEFGEYLQESEEFEQILKENGYNLAEIDKNQYINIYEDLFGTLNDMHIDFTQTDDLMGSIQDYHEAINDMRIDITALLENNENVTDIEVPDFNEEAGDNYIYFKVDEELYPTIKKEILQIYENRCEEINSDSPVSRCYAHELDFVVFELKLTDRGINVEVYEV